MGLRIHKAMGWGFSGTNEEVMNLLREGWDDDLNTKTLPMYKTFLQNKYEVTDEMLTDVVKYKDKFLDRAFYTDLIQVSSHLRKKKKNYNGFDFITYCDEFDEELTQQAFVVTPFLVINEWKHSDDALDYAEVAYTAQNDADFELENTMKWLKNPQFPYISSGMHAVTGEPVSFSFYRELRNMQDIHKISGAVDDADEELCMMNGFESFADANKNVVAVVPQDVQDLCEWLQLFENPATVLALRPVILTMWG